MRLSHIKLAGFKSFTDPTHIAVPGQLVGIVGPNGCGKSNVMDALRWVLGESQARHLRGETMEDVIFSGAGERKAASRASVELVFDNSLGKAAGQWSQYAELSVRRVLVRNGESEYYVNNLRVRRRDVTDIFLGTGLGGRAYAIIEQGMISRIIEAKPEEIRVFLEEAAGVSKYRERRRETELRLGDTRENLLRVDDIRQELERQLQHLEQQAEVAAQYREFESRMHTAQRLLWLLKKRDAEAQRARLAGEIEKLANETEAGTARLRDAEKRAEELRVQHHAAGDALHAAQGELYAANAETARLEQQIRHVQENRLRLESRLAALRQSLEHHRQQFAAGSDSLESWRRRQEQAADLAQERSERAKTESERLPLAEQAFRAAQAELNRLQRDLAQVEQDCQIEETRREHAEKILGQLQERQRRLAQEKSELQPPQRERLDEARAELAAADERQRENLAALRSREQRIPVLEQAVRAAARALEQTAREITELQARMSALQLLQERIAHGGKIQAWLERHGLSLAPRLWQGVQIREGWENALEAALRERLNAIVLEKLDAAWLDDAPPEKLALYGLESQAAAPLAAHGRPAAPGAQPGEPLLDYVSCSDARLEAVLQECLRGVYAVGDLRAVLAGRVLLAPGQMLVCSDGHMLTRSGIAFYAPDSELHGVLTRSREIEQLAHAVTGSQARRAECEERARAAERELAQTAAEISGLRRDGGEAQQAIHRLQLEVLQLSQQHERYHERGGQIERDLGEIAAQIELETAQRQSAQDNLARSRAQAEALREHLGDAQGRYRECENGLNAQREAARSAERAAQEAGFQRKSCADKILELENIVASVGAQIGENEEQTASLMAERAAHDEEPLRQELQQALHARSAREQALAEARAALENAEHALREVEQQRLSAEQKLHPLRERTGELRLKEQEARLIAQQFEEQLAGTDEAALAPLLEKGAKASALQAEISRLNEQIAALGAVNLAALEELQSARERKTYLDAQAADLTEALTTLENAIRRIDRETRELLQDTFTRVNLHLEEMFPALFGGGQARLVLTGEEILDSGVQVIAQPPGKKNASIHLLSGGEKALTALSLVFSLFQLNPAPFCLMDEVDAPLDDSNTGRFCELVKKMARHTQFLFISHNKITMEIAEQLIGVTMQEPGVSRVVAVDIEEALKMREEALA